MYIYLFTYRSFSYQILIPIIELIEIYNLTIIWPYCIKNVINLIRW